MTTKIRKLAADAAPNVQCATPGCAHLASAHADVAAGDNTGACSMKGCDCAGFTAPDAPATPVKAPSPGKAAPSPAPEKAATSRRGRFVPAPPLPAVADPATPAPTDAPTDAPADIPALVAVVATAIEAALSSLTSVDLSTADGPTTTFVALVHAADNSLDLMDGTLAPDGDAGDQTVLAETVDACIVAARNAGDGIDAPSTEVAAALASVHDADVASGEVLAALGAVDPDLNADDAAPDESTNVTGDAMASRTRRFGRFADAPVIPAPAPDAAPAEVPAPTPAVDAGTGVTDAGDLAAAVDATLDAALGLLNGVDASTLPPPVAQALALLRAADATVDDLMDSLGVVDPVEDDNVLTAAGEPAAAEPAAIPDTTSGDTAPDNMAFSMPIMVIEGVDTGDGRFITPGCLTWRDLPFPVMAITKTTMGHDEAELVGRIDTIERVDLAGLRDAKTGEPFAAGVTGLRGVGVFTNTDEANRVAALIHDKFLSGVSVDIGDVRSTIEFLDDNGAPLPEMEDDGGDGDLLLMLDGEIRETLTEGRVMGVTICPFPAFEGAYIQLDDGTTTPQTRADAPEAAKELEATVASIVNVDEFGARDCPSCVDGAGLVASAGPTAPPASWFTNPELDGPTPLTITDDGRVFGHLATWGVCHTGVSGRCVTAPHSKTNYGYFRTGAVMTADGSLVSTGPITLGGGHADLPLSAHAAIAHYDEAGTGVTDVAAGDDRYGIWVAGAMRPDVSPEQVRRLRASALSGDWRAVGGNLELVAALAVNAPGFPIVRAQVASGVPVSLVAAGARQVMLAATARMVTDREMIAQMRAQWPVMQTLLLEREARATTLRASVKAGGLRKAVHKARSHH